MNRIELNRTELRYLYPILYSEVRDASYRSRAIGSICIPSCLFIKYRPARPTEPVRVIQSMQFQFNPTYVYLVVRMVPSRQLAGV